MLTARCGVLLALGCIVLAGCKGSTTYGPTTYQTVTVPAPAASTPSATSASPSAPSTSPAALVRHLPGECGALLPLGSVVDAIGHGIGSRGAFVLGVGDSATARLSYLNCQYGLAKGLDPAVEIQVSLYASPAKAAARVQPTIDDYVGHAATPTKTTVDSQPATILTGGAGAGYGPTIVMASGQRTIAVTLRDGKTNPNASLLALAGLALSSTAG